jgi:hypothetical protein
MNQIGAVVSNVLSVVQWEMEKVRMHPEFDGIQFGTTLIVITAFATAFWAVSHSLRRGSGRS